MSRPAYRPVLTKKERTELERLSKKSSGEYRIVQRARLVLMSDQGLSDVEIAKTLSLNVNTVATWRKRFNEYRLEGLYDRPRSGRPLEYDKEQIKEAICYQLTQPVPDDVQSFWDGPLLSEVLEIPKYIIWEILKKAGIKLQVHKTWCSSTDPNFLEKFVDITGLYHIAQEQKDEDGPVILSCDEKSSIQSKQKNLGYVKTSSGKIVNGEESTYKRHGVVNLLSALEVATGKVHSKTYPRKRRIEFLKFMDHTVSKYPDDKEIHIILDNYGVHKNCDEWLNNHPNVTFHFTPTSASWLNLVEVFFCILTRKVLRGASFSSTKDLERRIKCFIKAYNKKCRPYVYRSREIKGSQLKNTLKNLVN